jgi:hypothetical protein
MGKMSVDPDREDAALVLEIAAEIHRFVQSFPNSYASRALAGLINREAGGEAIGDDERELVLMTLVREAKAQARARRFGRE